MAAAAVTVSTAVTLAYVIGVVVQPQPWREPQPDRGGLRTRRRDCISLICVRLAVARYLTPAHQLRRYLR